MSTQIKAILFDKDGTLFDFDATWAAWAHRFLTGLCAGDEAKAAFLGGAIGFDYARKTFHSESPVIAGTPEEIASMIGPFVDLPLPELIARMNNEAAVAPQAEAVPLIPFFHHMQSLGLRTGVVTNDGEAPARAHLDAAGALPLLDFVAGFDSGYGAKPEPGPLLAFAEAMGLAPADVVMVGDSLHDLMAARAAGMHAVGVLTGLAEAAILAPFADAVLPDIGALPEWLAERNG